MSADDVLLYFCVLISPYAFLLTFRPPFTLRIDTANLNGATEKLCRFVWLIVIASGVLLLGAAYAFKHNQIGLAAGLALCAAPVFALLVIPGAQALKQNYGWDRQR